MTELQLNVLFNSVSLELNSPRLKVFKPHQGTLLQVARGHGFEAKSKKGLYAELLKVFEYYDLAVPDYRWKEDDDD